MNRTEATPFADPELLELFGNEPELLAIADAIKMTTPRTPKQPQAIRARLLAVAAVAAAAMAVAVVAPWHGSGQGIVGKALAAVGDQPVLHTIVSVNTGRTLVDLSTGTSQPESAETETWYDPAEGLEHSITRINGVVTGDLLTTPQGTFDHSGRVPDCSWIAAHPVEATQMRISCNFNGDSGTVQKNQPEQPPTIDPALSGYLTQYRDALQNGQAHEIGTGTLDGESVIWLALTLPDLQPPPGAPGAREQRSEQVAIDSQTYKPVLVRSYTNGSNDSEYQVIAIDTISIDAANFTKPAVTPSAQAVSGWQQTASENLTPAEVATAFGGYWPGETTAGLPLAQLALDTDRVSFQTAATAPVDAQQLEVAYGSLDPSGDLDRTNDYVQIDETRDPTLAATGTFAPPAGITIPVGSLLVESGTSYGPPASPGGQAAPTGQFWTGQLKIGDTAIRIQASTEALLITTAQDLAPIATG